MAKEQRQIVFSGRVQGVGFRYTACHVANRYDVAGYVRNLDDGSVECVVEGEADEIARFLADLKGRMAGYIHKQTQQVAPYTGQYTEFNVAF